MTIETSTDLRVVEAGGVKTLVLNRPPLNVLNIDFMRRLEKMLKDEAILEGARLLAISAEGKAFCAGVDIADHTPERTREMLELFHELILTVMRFPLPTVALVGGAALGGGMELALACDLILASDRAKFAVPEITLGVFPPVAMAVLPRTIGHKRAAELIFTGASISARDAERYGLVNAVFEKDEFEASCSQYLGKLTKLSGAALSQTKRSLIETAKEPDPQKALKLAEERYLNDLMATSDAKEGIRAFMEKREPVWADR